MAYEQTYIFFNLLLVGLVTSEIYHKHGRSQRLGLALGLIFIGLFMALRFFKFETFLRREWLSTAGVLLIIISLVCAGEVLWGETLFKMVMIVLFLLVGLLSALARGEIGNLPPVFWLFLSVGAVVTTFTLGRGSVDLGAYIGAWLWLIFGLAFSRT